MRLRTVVGGGQNYHLRGWQLTLLGYEVQGSVLPDWDGLRCAIWKLEE